MTSILKELRSWAATLPYWEQATLEKIVKGVQLAESDYDELLQWLLEDEGLEEPTKQRPELQFPRRDDIFKSSSGQIRLLRIFNMQNINALVSGQILTFGPALTAIFGANGSGKSGYARVLGCAGFTRGDKEVLPDIAQPSYTTAKSSADIEISEGTSTKVIRYQIDDKCQELSQFYIFDSTSVRVHLTGPNTFSFSPAGLSYLTQLTEETDKVRQRLDTRIEKYKQPHSFNAFFQGESEITKLIANLGPETDLEELKRLATLTLEEKKRIKQLDTKIAELKTKDTPKQLSKLKQTIDDLQNLIDRLLEIENKLNDEKIREVNEAVKEYCKRQSAAQLVSINQFKSEHSTQVGSAVWRQFVEAAKALAEAEQTRDMPYPQADDHCLLCQQHLSPEARDFLLRLWAFLEGKTQIDLDVAQKALDEKYSNFNAINLRFFDDQSVSYRHLQEHDQTLLRKILKFIGVCRQRQEIALGIINTHEEKIMPKIPESGTADIEKIIIMLKAEQDKLQKEDSAQQISELVQQLLTLQHLEILSQNISEIQEYVQKQIWAERAAKIRSSTRHITQKYSELFAELVTDRYIELFEQTLRDLKRPLKVTVKTIARKGKTSKQIVLKIDATGLVDLGKVLSEGEKRAVAFADFLTEVALDTNSNGIVLDDPVTSLDLEWKNIIASLLVREANRRQVIVFTHDLPFLYYLKKYAEDEPVEITTHWIKRGDYDGKPGYVFLDNSPALEQEYRKSERARELYKKAKDAPAAEQENLLCQGFGALRSAYEALIIFDLFNEVIMRFDERVSFGRLKDVVWDKSIAEEVVKKCELLSRYIEGHLHSDAFAATKPTCEALREEIEAFDALKSKVKNLKKN